MAFNFGTQTPGTLSDINITPLVDIMLVLLIIFMVTTPMLKEGIELNLPQATPHQFEVESEDRFVVSINHMGNIYLNSAKIPLENLGQKMQELYEKKANKAVYLEADQRIMYGKVVEVMDIIRSAGIINIGMVTKEKILVK